MKPSVDVSKNNASSWHTKVLIIEDNDDQWLLIQNAMQRVLSGVTCVRVATPEEAIDLLYEWNHQEWELPKLILLDLYLPTNEAGWELLMHIKGMRSPINWIPVVVLSSSANGDDILKAYRLGASSYLVKPYRISDWFTYFRELKTYWWETASLPPLRFTWG